MKFILRYCGNTLNRAWSFVDFFQKRTSLQLHCLRRIEISLPDVTKFSLPICEWTAMMTCLSENCTSLQELEACVDHELLDGCHYRGGSKGFQDRCWEGQITNGSSRSGNSSLQSKADEPLSISHLFSDQYLIQWLKCLLKVRPVRFLKLSVACHLCRIRVEDDRKVFDLCSACKRCPNIRLLTELFMKPPTVITTKCNTMQPIMRHGSFDFMKLPVKVQQSIIRYAILPPSGILNPGVKLDIGPTLQSIRSLLRTCHYIHNLGEEILYSEAVFACCSPSQATAFVRFLKTRNSRQLSLMRSYYCKPASRIMWYKVTEPPMPIKDFISTYCPDMKEVSVCANSKVSTEHRCPHLKDY
jgi:hypothetical protein